MTMRALFSAISGLRNHITFMDVVGNNIANVNTIAFKSNRVSFQDVLGQTLRGAAAPQASVGGTDPVQIGLGMQLGGVRTIHTQGSLQSTGKATDFAIQGDGFFLVSDSARTYYTRDGSFDVSVNGDLVSPISGLKVLGWAANQSGIVDTTIVPAPISIPFGTQIAAKATTTVGLTGNVDANHSVGQAFSTTATMIDSLGVEHPVKMALTKKASNQWTVTTSADATATLQGGGTGSVDTVTGTPTQEIRPGSWSIISDVGGNLTAVFTPTGGSAEPAVVGTITASGTNTTLIPGLTLTNGGVLQAGTDQIDIAGGTDVNFSSTGQYLATNPAISINLTVTTGANTPLNVTLNLTGVTQFADSGQIVAGSNDGQAAGSLVSFAVGSSGNVSGIFSNGSNQSLGQIALALFTNPAGLAKEGNNLFGLSANSGDPIVGLPGTNGRGVVTPGALEGSNSDLAQEFTSVIMAQRGFQASARVITAADEMLQDLVNIKR